MITVSTTSPAEARLAAEAMQDGMPPDVAWSVYLNGALHTEHGAPPVHPADDRWPAPEPEVRGG